MRGHTAFMAYFDRPRPMGRNEHTLDSPLDPSGHFFALCRENKMHNNSEQLGLIKDSF